MGLHRYYQHAEIPHPHPGPPLEGEGEKCFPHRGCGQEKEIMKVMASVKKMCRKCKIIKRKRVVRVICTDPRHKQRQG